MLVSLIPYFSSFVMTFKNTLSLTPEVLFYIALKNETSDSGTQNLIESQLILLLFIKNGFS